MRTLWTASSGMAAQEANIGVISNNLANVNTTAFKTSKMEFQDLLYQKLQHTSYVNGQGRVVGLELGTGVVQSATAKDFGEGNFNYTGETFDFAISGPGFFKVKNFDGSNVYTRDGGFKVSASSSGQQLVTSEGRFMLDDAGNPITIPTGSTNVAFNKDGSITYVDSTGTAQVYSTKVALVTFLNRQGLDSIGENLYAATDASGAEIANADAGKDSSELWQGYLETSNVKVVDEMVRLIMAEKAYQLNSKAVQAADEMLGEANNLRR